MEELNRIVLNFRRIVSSPHIPVQKEYAHPSLSTCFHRSQNVHGGGGRHADKHVPFLTEYVHLMTENVLKAHVVSDSRYQSRVSRQGNARSIGFIGELAHQFGGKMFRLARQSPIPTNEDFLPLTDGFGYDEDHFSHLVVSLS